MRAARIVTGSIVAITVGIFACGGSSQDKGAGGNDASAPDVAVGNPEPGLDSSASDATIGVATDGGEGDAGDDAMCVADADLNTAAPNDASLDDAGASVGTCINCARTSCHTQVENCNADCTCNNIFNCLFGCLGSVGGTLLICYETCGGSISGGAANATEIGLVKCAASQCGNECAACSISASFCSNPPPKDASAPDANAGDDGAAGDASGD